MSNWGASVIFYASIAGVVLSLYALYVEHKKAENEMFVAMCDINSWVACSKVFTSEYGRMMSKLGLIEKGSMLDVPNAAYGVLFYLCAMVHWQLTFLPKSVRSLMMLAASALSCASSVWLAYALYFELQDACIVCISTYVVNTIIFIASVNSVSASLFPPVHDKAEAAAQAFGAMNRLIWSIV